MNRYLPVFTFAAFAALLSSASAGPAFDISSSFEPSTDLRPGYYACRSGLDYDNFTSQFDVLADGTYVMRGIDGQGTLAMSPEDGTIDIVDGPLASDDTASTYARNTYRVSDGNNVIIIRFDFGDVVTDDYCARVAER